MRTAKTSSFSSAWTSAHRVQPVKQGETAAMGSASLTRLPALYDLLLT